MCRTLTCKRGRENLVEKTGLIKLPETVQKAISERDSIRKFDRMCFSTHHLDIDSSVVSSDDRQAVSIRLSSCD